MNHINFLEVPLLYVFSLPTELVGLAKKETWQQPVIGRLAEWWGAIPIDRAGDVSALKRSIRALQEGRILALAPEGTRSGDGRMRHARPGIVTIAKRTGASIIPVAHWGGERFWSNLKSLRRTVVTIRVGRPFCLSEDAGVAERQARREAADEIMGQVAGLLPEAYRGVYTEDAHRVPRYLEFIEEAFDG